MQGLSSLTSILISIDLRTGLKLKKQVCEVRRTLLSRRRITFPVLSSSISSWLGRTRWREDSPDLFKLTAISVSFVFNEVTPGKTKTLNRKTTATYFFFSGRGRQYNTEHDSGTSWMLSAFLAALSYRTYFSLTSSQYVWRRLVTKIKTIKCL